MNTQIKTVPEADLIHQLAAIRQSLQAERDALMARVASIDEALGGPAKGTHTVSPKGAQTLRTPKPGGIREGVLNSVSTPLTMKEIQTLLSDHSPKSVESVVHALVQAGRVSKDSSSPKKFSLVQAK